MAGESKTSARRLAANAKQQQALELRKAGATYETIAQSLGYSSPSGAYQAIESAMKRTLQEPADDLRRLEIERLNAMLLSIWPSVRQGNYGAIDRALRIMERTAKLLGLDAPAKQEISGADGGAIPIAFVDYRKDLQQGENDAADIPRDN